MADYAVLSEGRIRMTAIRTKLKMLAAAFAAGAMIFTLTGCNTEPEEPPPMKTVTMTDEYGDLVTDADGNPAFTEVPLETILVTDDFGAIVTDESGNPQYEYEELPEPEKIVYKVGFVYSGPVEGSTTNLMFEAARAQIKKSLGLDTCYIENVLVADFPEAVEILRDAGCNIIVSTSQKFANSVDREARVLNGTTYISFGGEKTSACVTVFGGELYQTAAVTGMAAAHNTVTNKIGIISDPGQYNVYGVLDAFCLGAAEILGAQTDVRVEWAWSNSEEEIRASVDDLIAQGCDVIMSYMESDYAVRYAAGKGVKLIANAANIPELAPDDYLTGFHFNFSTHVVDKVRSVMNDNFNPTKFMGDIGAGMIRLVEFSPAAKTGTGTICSKYYDYIKSGSAKIFTGEIKNANGIVMVEKGQSLEASNIFEINWLINTVRRTTSFTEINENPTSSDFVIKGSTAEETSETSESAETTEPAEDDVVIEAAAAAE